MSFPRQIGPWANPFEYLVRARKSKSRTELRRLLRAAKEKLCQARTVGWPALIDSWQRDVDAIEAIQRQLVEQTTKPQSSAWKEVVVASKHASVITILEPTHA
jgi:hypothetical protein